MNLNSKGLWIGAATVLLAVAGGIWFFGGSDKIPSYIPDDAGLVLRFDPKEIIRGMDMEKVGKNAGLKDLEEKLEDEDAMLMKLLLQGARSPEKTGIRWSKSFYVFARTEKGKEYVAVMLPVKDQELLKTFVDRELPDDAKIKFRDDMAYVQAGYREAWGWNNDVLMVVFMDGRRHTDLIQDHLNKTYDVCMDKKPEFEKIIGKKADIAMYMNTKSGLFKELMREAGGALTKGLAAQNIAYSGAYLNFDKGEMLMEGFNLDADGKKIIPEYMKEAALPEKITGTPDGKAPLLHFSMNVEWMPLMKAFAGSMPDEEMPAEMMDLMKEVEDGFCIQASATRLPMTADTTWTDWGYPMVRKPNPIGVSIRIPVKANAPKLDTALSQGGQAGISQATSLFWSQSFVVSRPPGMLRMLMDQEEKGTLKAWTDDRLPSDFASKPMQIWVDLSTKNNPLLNGDSDALGRGAEKVADALGKFSHIVGWTDKDESVVKIVLKDKEAHFLSTLFEMIGDLNDDTNT
jgi:hypothetical protein